MRILIVVSILYFHVGEVHSAENCTGKTDSSLKIPGCTINMMVNWWPIAPYIYKKEVDVKGSLKNLVELLIRDCCGECVNFQYANPANDSEALKNEIGTNGSVLSFPLYGDQSTQKFKSVPFFSVIEAPGIIYLQGPEEEGKTSGAVIGAVFQGWPILLLTLVMAGLSGMIMWALDSYWNPQHFPTSFIRGSWEGFWWAFVSMTTVGYGDRAPKSFIARVFAFFWVLVGLVIISIFTATVTTSLTALSLSNTISLYGSNVVGLRNTEEQRYGVRNNAKVFSVNSVKDFATTLQQKKSLDTSDEIAGGLIDSYVAGHNKDLLSAEKGIRFGDVFDYQYTYGFVISNNLNTQNMEKCLRRSLNTYEGRITEVIQNELKAFPLPELNAAQQTSGNLFDAKSDIFQRAVFGCLGMIAFLSLCCLLWEHCYWKPKMKKEKQKPKNIEVKRILTPHTSFEELVAAQCHDLEEKMVTQVMTFYQEFHKKLNQIRRRHSIVSTKLNKEAFKLEGGNNASTA